MRIRFDEHTVTTSGTYAAGDVGDLPEEEVCRLLVTGAAHFEPDDLYEIATVPDGVVERRDARTTWASRD